MVANKNHIVLLFLFVTFLVMNGILFHENIGLIAKYGKLTIAIIGIIILQKSYKQFIFFAKNNKWLFFFWGLCMLFMALRVIEKGINITLIQNNILFMLFIYFAYLLSFIFKRNYHKPNYYFFKYFANTLNINLLFWTLITFVLSIDIWHISEGRTGLKLFYGGYIQLGIFSAVGTIVNFSVLKYNVKKGRKIYGFMFIVFLGLVILANSRNSQLIVFLFLLLNLIPYLKKIAFKYIWFFVPCLLLLFIIYFSKEDLLTDNFIGFTTGRSWIWYLVFDYFSQHSIFMGEGISGLNETLLEINIDSSSYYLNRIETLHLHSSYLEVIAASGIMGFMFFMVYVFRSLRKRKQFYVVIISVSVIAGGLFESFLLQPTILISFLFWYLIVADIAYLPKPEKIRN